MVQGLLQSDSFLSIWLQELSDEISSFWADSPPYSFTEIVLCARSSKECIFHAVIGECQSAAESMIRVLIQEVEDGADSEGVGLEGG